MKLINIHTHRSSDNASLSVRSCQPGKFETVRTESNTYFSIGIHPWFIKNNLESLNLLKEVTKESKVLLIGETGLDKTRGPELSIQKEWFIRHIELSEALNKPLIIHCVKAYNEIISLRKALRPTQNWIFHGYNSSITQMNQAIEAGFYLSFGSAVLNTHQKAPKAIEIIPLNRLFLETDDANITIREIYDKASSIINIQPTDLINHITHNFNSLFK